MFYKTVSRSSADSRLYLQFVLITLINNSDKQIIIFNLLVKHLGFSRFNS